MSGIYGIYRHDGAPADPQWLEQMRAAMAYYGPQGGGCKVEGPVGMGHLLLEINPEDAFENQPVQGVRGPVVSAARLLSRLLVCSLADSPPGPSIGKSSRSLTISRYQSQKLPQKNW